MYVVFGSEFVWEFLVTDDDFIFIGVVICTDIPSLTFSIPKEPLAKVAMVKVDTSAVVLGLVKSEDICKEMFVFEGIIVISVKLIRYPLVIFCPVHLILFYDNEEFMDI